jgi:hypothetical protein
MSTPALTLNFLFQAGSEHYPFQSPHQGARRPVVRGGQETYGYNTRQKTTYLDEPDREDYRDPAASSEFQYYEDEADTPEREYAPSAGIVRPPGQLSSLVRRPAPNRRFSLPPGWPPFCKKLVFNNTTIVQYSVALATVNEPFFYYERGEGQGLTDTYI